MLAARTAAPSSEKININFVCEIVNFDSPNLIILKKKFKNTTKYHNIFTILLFLGSEYIYIYILFEINAISIILEQILNNKLLLVLN